MMVGPFPTAAASGGMPTPSADQTRQMRSLIDRLPALIGYWDRGCRNVIANSAYVDYFGLTPDEIRGRHISEVLGEAVYALNRPYIEGVLAGEEQLFERTLIDQRGRTRCTQASYIPDVVDGEVRGFYVQVTDVTARVEAERARDEAVQLFEISMKYAPIGMIVVDEAGVVLQANPAICRLLGRAEGDIVGRDFRRFVHPDNLETGNAQFAALLDGSATDLSSEHKYLRADGTSVWLQRDFVLVPGVKDGRDLAIAQFQDITARMEAEAQLARLAVTDPLTGLQNRLALVAAARRHHAESPDLPLGVLFIDLDGFKQVNDSHGHAFGDTVLAAVGHRLERLVTPHGTAFRIGGDEFVVLAPGASSAPGLLDYARHIAEELSGVYEVDTVRVALAASVGHACGVTDDIEDLLRAADADMYRHKRNPR